MTTIELVATAVILACDFKNKAIDREVRIECMEQFVNCAVIGDGKTTPDLLKKCSEKVSKILTK